MFYVHSTKIMGGVVMGLYRVLPEELNWLALKTAQIELVLVKSKQAKLHCK